MKRIHESPLPGPGVVFRSLLSPTADCSSWSIPVPFTQPGCATSSSGFPVTDNDFAALPTEYPLDTEIDTNLYDDTYKDFSSLAGTGPITGFVDLWGLLGTGHKNLVYAHDCYCFGEGITRPSLVIGSPSFPVVQPLSFFWIPPVHQAGFFNDLCTYLTGMDPIRLVTYLTVEPSSAAGLATRLQIKQHIQQLEFACNGTIQFNLSDLASSACADTPPGGVCILTDNLQLGVGKIFADPADADLDYLSNKTGFHSIIVDASSHVLRLKGDVTTTPGTGSAWYYGYDTADNLGFYELNTGALDEKVKADITDPTADYLAAKVQKSIVNDAVNHAIQLTNDEATPDALDVYAFYSTKGWKALTDLLKALPNYDLNKLQVLVNDNGTIEWQDTAACTAP